MGGLSSADAAACAQYLRKKHGIDEELFHRIHDALVIVEQVGFEDSEDELARLRHCSEQLSTLVGGEKKHLLTHPKEVYTLQRQEIAFETSLAQLLKKAKESLKKPQQEALVAAINKLLKQLPVVIAQEEAALEKNFS